MILLIGLIVAALAAGLFDSWTTDACIKAGLEENGILTKHIIGVKPSTLKVYLFDVATWAILTAVSLYAFGLVGLVALVPSIVQLFGHLWAGIHNMGQYDSWTTRK
jgi:hypothetical protein